MRADRAAGHRTALLAALASAVLSLCAAKETLQRIFPGGATTPAAAVDASASQSAADDGPVAEESPERTPIIIVAVVGVTVLFLGCLIWCKRRRSDRRASITQHRVCPSGAAAVSRLCSPDVRAAFLDAPVPPHATTIQLRDLQYELLQLRPPPAFEAMAESAWLEMVHSQQIADCDGSSCERCIQRTQVLQFWGSYTESTRMAPLPRKARFSAQDALSLGPFDVQLNLSFYPPETDMEPEVERQVDAVVARGVSKGAAWGVRGSALERDAGYDICGVYNARTGRIVWTETYTDSKSRAVFSGELLELSKGCSSSHSKGGVLQPNALFENMCEAPEAAAPNGKPSQQVVITVGGDSGGDGPRLWMLRGAYASNSHVCGAYVAFGYVASEAASRLLRPPLPEHLEPVNKKSQQFRREALEFASGKSPAQLFGANDITPAALLRVAAKATAEVDVPASFCGRVAASKPWHAYCGSEDDDVEFRSITMRDLR